MLKTIVIDKYSPYKHLCQIDEDNEVVPYATFPIDHKIEGEWDDKWVVIQAYKVYKFGDQVKSTIMDDQEQGKHLKLYSALLELDGRIETHPFNFDTMNRNNCTIQSREQARDLMITLLAVNEITKDISDKWCIERTLSKLLKFQYQHDVEPIEVELPKSLASIIGTPHDIMKANHGTGTCEEGNE